MKQTNRISHTKTLSQFIILFFLFSAMRVA